VTRGLGGSTEQMGGASHPGRRAHPVAPIPHLAATTNSRH